MRRPILTAILAVVLAATMAGPALAYDFPSTNDENRANGFPHVNLVDAGAGFVELEFVNDTNSLAFFEYRIDGELVTSGTPHPVVTGDFIYDGVTVDSRGIDDPVVETQTFDAARTVEVRLALGGERDWDFDWVEFAVPDPGSKDDCKADWTHYGFRNQGQCIRFALTGQDAR